MYITTTIPIVTQIDTADKQLKATRQFLEEQAIEREQERDEFLKEIENLKAQIRDKEKERSSYANASEEVSFDIKCNFIIIQHYHYLPITYASTLYYCIWFGYWISFGLFVLIFFTFWFVFIWFWI